MRIKLKKAGLMPLYKYLFIYAFGFIVLSIGSMYLSFMFSLHPQISANIAANILAILTCIKLARNDQRVDLRSLPVRLIWPLFSGVIASGYMVVLPTLSQQLFELPFTPLTMSEFTLVFAANSLVCFFVLAMPTRKPLK